MTTAAPSKPACPEWICPDAVLREEANQIHTGKEPRVAPADPNEPDDGEQPASKSAARWTDIPETTKGMALCRELYDRYSTALCLSGGGIRSASFNVGVIEALAVHPRRDSDAKRGEVQAADHKASFLSQFDYLSTVSGGGYIGSWLSAWIAREGYAAVWPKLVGRREKPEKEPSEIVWLRSYSNFLTPRKGLMSADTWTGVALVIRNLVLNWLVIIPVLCLALLTVKLLAVASYWIPRAFDASPHALAWLASLPGAILPEPGSGAFLWVVHWFGFETENPVFWLGVIAPVPLVFALRYGLVNRPSLNPGILEWVGGQYVPLTGVRARHRVDKESARVGAGGSETEFKWWDLALALISAFLLSLCLALSYFAFEKYHLAGTVVRMVAIGVVIYLAAWLIARLQIAVCRKPFNRPRAKGLWHWCRDLAAWIAAGVVFGALVGVGMHILATTFGHVEIEQMRDAVCADANICLDLQTYATLALLVAGVPWIITAQLTAEMIFVGLTNWEDDSDADREWFGRSTGWFTVTAIAWFSIAILVILGPPLVALVFAKYPLAKYGTTILTALSGGVSTILGQSGKTSATDQGPQKSPWWMQLILPVSTIVFLILLVLGVSAALDRLLLDHWLVESPLLGSGDAAKWCIDLIWLLGGAAAAVLIAAGASYFVNINRFSLHSLYRNRLIRGYLGASNASRAPNPFTGFDESDNKPMAELWPHDPNCAAKEKLEQPAPSDWRPFHIVNIALNVVSGKRLAWQERKAESLTVSPLHSGSAANGLGYRPTFKYGDGKGKGITLGTALAISGAAASPNMGYHSSPLVTLLLALFNVRLGWWLGNPGAAGKDTYQEDGPEWAALPLLNEMFGRTTDEQDFVYLSDGGHFENLGLYEMIRRRCRCIVVCDAGQDPNYDFADLGNAVRKIAIDLGVYISFGELREIKARSKDNSVIKGAYFAIGEIDYKTAPERSPAPGATAEETEKAEDERKNVDSGYILYIKPSYHGTESAGIVSYAAANAAFPHEPTFELFYGESQFESYRTLGFEIVDSVLKQGKANAEKLWAPGPSGYSMCQLISALYFGPPKPAPSPLVKQVVDALSEEAAAELRSALGAPPPEQVTVVEETVVVVQGRSE